MKTFRIFLASPGDVAQERRVAREVIDHLRSELRFRDHLNLQVVAWDQPGYNMAMPMGMTPQKAISKGMPQPRECDLVLILLWSRMGTPLPDEYVKADGSRYLSGTEWEYWNAFEAFENNGAPNIWMYRRTDEPSISLSDANLEEKRQQWELLQEFLGMIDNPDGSIAHGVNEYSGADNFGPHLERHLRHHLEEFLQADGGRPVENSKPATVIVAPDIGAKPQQQKAQQTSPRVVKQSASNHLPFPSAAATGEDEFGHWARWEHQKVEQLFRWIPPGTFMMGSPDNEPERYDNEVLHKVTLTKGFWLADTTVTQALWQVVMGNNPSHFKGDQRPVENVSWDDAQEFIRILNHEYSDMPFRLPTEAEWEYACRAGTNTPFSLGANITPELVNYKGQYHGQTVAVKSLPANPWGLYEMHGNVWEWCQDYWQDQLTSEAVTDPSGPVIGAKRVVRGGSWIFGGWLCRSAYRSHYVAAYRVRDLGFRLSRGHPSSGRG